MTQRQPKPQTQRYAIVLVTQERSWGVLRDYGYCHGPEALATVARLRRHGHDARLALSDPQGVPAAELARLGLPPGRARQRWRGQVWY